MVSDYHLRDTASVRKYLDEDIVKILLYKGYKQAGLLQFPLLWFAGLLGKKLQNVRAFKRCMMRLFH